jgi:thioredoxin-related protein
LGTATKVSGLTTWKKIMTERRYRVVFEGEILDGLKLEEVKRSLATLFRANEAQIERFFSGKRLAIKKDVDHETAMKYSKAFERAGALCRVEELEAHAGLEQPLMMEKEKEEPRQQDLMICPKCQFEQEESEECVRCGIVVSKFYQRPHALAAEARPGGPEADLVAFRGVQRWVISFSTVLVILALAGVTLFAYKNGAEEKNIGKISFYTDYDKGLDAAFKSGRPVMLVFSASWCGACKQMIKNVFSHDDVASASTQLVNIYIDVDKAKRQLVNEYQVRYVPSVFFLDYSGETIIQVADRRSPDDFIENIDYMVRVHSDTSQN